MSPAPEEGRLVDTVALVTERDVAKARRAVSKALEGLKARSIVKTRFVTAVSEIARNAVVHGGGGEMRVYVHAPLGAIGIACQDDGDGIADVEMALRDGFSTAKSLGKGLGGAQRLVDAFEIDSRVGRGTIVRMMSSL